MVVRSLLLLIVALAASVAATVFFGDEVLLALGLILVQLKVLWKSLLGLSAAEAIVWLKSHAAAFFRVELLKKWINVSLLPMLLGRPILRRIGAVMTAYRKRVTRHGRRLLVWYGRLTPVEQALAGAILIFATLALSVTSVGLWLVLFSVKLPLWFAGLVAATLRMIWLSVEKSVFRTVAFLQLNWAWRGLRWLLPEAVMRRKRRFDYRILRAVVRRRRLTVSQLAARKDRLPFRLSLLVGYLFPDPKLSRMDSQQSVQNPESGDPTG